MKLSDDWKFSISNDGEYTKEDGDNVNLPIQRKRKRYDRCKK
jgi:hypothetical protein